MSEKSRVFISCGQRKDAEYLKRISRDNLELTKPEFTVAKEIAEELEKMGFETYIALEQQTPQGVKEEIFKRLENAEYFLFVDFRRERLYDEGDSNFLTQEYRGSLFSNQELAIATFRGHEILAFQEKGIKKEDGILRYIQANCIPFSKRQELPSIVAQKVKERKWDATWRNELLLKRGDGDFEDAPTRTGELRRFYHIKVVNNHKDKTARNCVGYVERIRNLGNGDTRTPELVELKWKGVTTVEVSIAPKKDRCLDAFFIHYANQKTANLGLNPFIVDWEGYVPEYQIAGSGDYEIDYVVFSENFSPARARFRLHLGTRIRDVVFRRCHRLVLDKSPNQTIKTAQTRDSK